MHKNHNQITSDIPDWLILEMDAALATITDAEVRSLAVQRVLTKYLSASMRATSTAFRERAESALFHFLTARPAPRKRWSLDEGPATEVVMRVREAAARLLSEEAG